MKRFGTTNRQLYRRPGHRTIAGVAAVGPGVNNNTLSVVDLIYIYAFSMSGSSNYNSASALGVVLMLVLGAFSGAYLWLSRARG